MWQYSSECWGYKQGGANQEQSKDYMASDPVGGKMKAMGYQTDMRTPKQLIDGGDGS